ncbi:MAG: methyl-accepting chemotaxis protein [Planctomycetaceae bacterium]|nr:methyl-accepting chemotaxis protein [Planctomycetaceae bacterium]
MLNRYKIGTKLTAGFIIVLALLITTAAVGYYALHRSKNSTEDMVHAKDLLFEMQHYYQCTSEAMVHASLGVLFQDVSAAQRRQETDAEIKAIEQLVESQFDTEDTRRFAELTALYQKFLSEDNEWFRLETERVQLQDQFITTGNRSVESLESCMAFAKNAMLDSTTQDGKVDLKLVELLLDLEECMVNVQNLRRGYYRIRATPDPEAQRAIVDETRVAGSVLTNHLGEVSRTIEDAELQRMIGNTIVAVQEWGQYLDTILDMMARQGAILTAHSADYAKMAEILDNLMTSLHGKTQAMRTQSASNDAMMVLLIEVISVIAVIVGLVLAYVISRNISRGVSEATHAIEVLAMEGDVTVAIPKEYVERKDEVGDLAMAVNQIINQFQSVEKLASNLADGNYDIEAVVRGDKDSMNINLNKMLTEINADMIEIGESAQQVATGANEVSLASQNLSNGAQETAASLQQITASMSEISSSTKQNAGGATQARDLMKEASKVAAEGQAVMLEMTTAMHQITANSNEIQRVIKVVDDIAFQTNLLALNAAVEAARAGQHGKGFAVVAEEVRNLASRSAKAARETAELIEKSSQEIVRGDEIASHTSGVFDTIVEQIKQSTDLVASIAVASNEQAQGVGQITSGLHQIDAATQSNTASAEQSASAAQQMSGMATNLQKMVGRFKLRAG